MTLHTLDDTIAAIATVRVPPGWRWCA